MKKEYFNIGFVFEHDNVDSIIEEHIYNNKAGYVCSLDGNNFSIAMNDPEHLKVLNAAIVNNCDSTWVPTMVNRIYGTNYSNYCGADLFLNYIGRKKYKQFFLGSSRNVLDGLKKEMAKIDPATLNMDMFGQMQKHMNLSVPICLPEDVANILLFLASDESRALTGQIIVSDFGATL